MTLTISPRKLPSYVVVDTETTGLGHFNKPPRPDGIVQVGIAWRDPNGSIGSWGAVCNPGAHYLKDGRADEAFRINRRGVREVLGRPIATGVAGRLKTVLRGLGDPPLRAYNLGFDRPFLQAAPWDLDAKRFGPCIMLDAHQAFAKARGLHPSEVRWPSLKEACAHYQIDVTRLPAHDAENDAILALQVAEKIECGAVTPL